MRFAVIDLTGTISRAELDAYAAAQQRQLREDYASCYDGDGVLDEVTVIGGVPLVVGESLASTLTRIQMLTAASGDCPIIIWPSVPPGGPDGAIGVHDRLNDGRPVCNGYLDLAIQNGDTITSVLSHEVLETRADPRLHACVEFDNGEIWDREICDRVEADSYTIDGVVLSNFNTPACFEPNAHFGITGAAHKPPHHAAPHEKFDFLGKSTKPNQVRPGGYAQRFDPNQGWVMIGAMRGYRQALADKGMTRGTKRRARRIGAVAVVAAALGHAPAT